jgi:TonB family protein
MKGLMKENAEKDSRPQTNGRTLKQWVFVTRLVLSVLLLLGFSFESRCQTKESAPAKPNNWIIFRLLTRTDADLSKYLQTFFRKVRSKWESLIPQSARPDENASVVVRIRIANDGTLAGKTPTIEHSSGKKALDDAAIAAIRDSAPFEHLPLSVGQIEVGIEFNYGRPTRKI